MNPLVTEVKSIDPPRTAASDEFFSNWYEITEIISWGFGMKKKIKFYGVFHDQPWGMQSHIYAPMNTDMRQTYRVGGNQPGEPKEVKELGVDTPAEGLYIREEVNVKVNTPLVGGFVQKEMQAASKVMIDRITRKAELLDEGKLHAMFEQGKLKTAKPSGEATFADRPQPSPVTSSAPGSPPLLTNSDFSSQPSPALDSKGFGKYYEVAPGRAQSVRSSQYLPSYQQPGYQGPDNARAGAEIPGSQYGQQSFVSELPGSSYHSNGLQPPPLRPNGQSPPQAFRAEMLGDTDFSNSPPLQQTMDQKPKPPNGIHPAYQRSPMPSPRLPSGSQPSRHSSASNYHIANPDHPSSNRQSLQSNHVEQWQRSVQSEPPIDETYYRNSRHSHSGLGVANLEPDHQRFSTLSVQENSMQPLSTQTSAAKCPVCGLFEVRL